MELTVYADKVNIDLEDNIVHIQGIDLAEITAQYTTADILDTLDTADIHAYLSEQLTEDEE